MQATKAIHVVLAMGLALAGCGGEGGEGGEVDPIAAMDAHIAGRKVSTAGADWRVRLPPPIQVGFPKDRRVHWILETNRGRMVVKLWHEVAPLHVSNLIYLTRLGFYDGLTFHRVIQGFMAQGGCPIGNGSGMPGYGLPVEVRKDVKHDRAGLLSTANTGRKNTDGSQFFLTFRPAPELDMGYTVYGEIVEGLDTLRLLEKDGASPQAPSSAPHKRLVIERATVELR